MSALVTIFNPHMRPVPYKADGSMLGGLETAEADLGDPVCALSLEQGHVVVLAPSAHAEMPNSEPVAEESAPELAADEAEHAEVISDSPEGEAEEAKPTTRKKSAPQASKE